jgi:hypothetical protein
MITGTKHVLGVPAAQRQSRDRRQGRRRRRRKPASDGEDGRRETRSATVIKIRGRAEAPEDPAADPAPLPGVSRRRGLSPPSGKRRRVDIRI